MKDQSSHCWELDLCRMSRNSEASYESRGRAVFWMNTDAVSITLQCCSARPCCMGGGKMCRLLQYLINIFSLGHSAHCRRTADLPLHCAAACTDLVTSTHGSAKATKIESSCLNKIPLQMLPMGIWGPENMKIKKFRWGLFEFYIFLS